MKENRIFIYTFYRFIEIKNEKNLKKKIDTFSNNRLIRGTILVAKEGINGSISGSKEDLDDLISFIKSLLNIRKLSIKVSNNDFIPFYRFKVRSKNEIVTIGDKKIKPSKKTGTYIKPKDWDNIIEDNKYIVIDTRNNYEIRIGSFKNSKNPKIKSFREFPKYIKNAKFSKKQPIAMFCTGGIRCEKASSYLIDKGFKNVSQLDGGILNYLEFKKNSNKSKWVGECFVFDNRVSVNHRLNKGSYDQCYGCRSPITQKEKKLKSYKKGVSCKFCIGKKTKKKIKSSSTRQTQINRAEKKGEDHPFKKIYSIL